MFREQKYLIKKYNTKKRPPQKPPSFAQIVIFITFIAHLLGFKINFRFLEQKRVLYYLASLFKNFGLKLE